MGSRPRGGVIERQSGFVEEVAMRARRGRFCLKVRPIGLDRMRPFRNPGIACRPYASRKRDLEVAMRASTHRGETGLSQSCVTASIREAHHGKKRKLGGRREAPHKRSAQQLLPKKSTNPFPGLPSAPALRGVFKVIHVKDKITEDMKTAMRRRTASAWARCACARA